MQSLLKSTLSSSLFALFVVGCTVPQNQKLVSLKNELDQTKRRNSDLLSEVDQYRSRVSSQEVKISQLKRAESASQANRSVPTGGGDLLPPNAKPGECYARVLAPPTYKTETKDVLKKEASFRIDVIPATYGFVNEKVLVKEASQSAKLVPAKYEWVVDKILVKEANEKIVTVPPEYRSVTEQVLIKPAYSTWKKGRGPIEKVDNATGEIMCLVEVPAQYKTVRKKVLAKPAETRTIQIPAKYRDVKKRVMVEPPKMVKAEIPAEYRTLKVRKVITPAQEKKIEIPAAYQTITNRIKVSDSYMEWRSILCETNTTPNIITKIQKALAGAGFNPGRVDGVIGGRTMGALRDYQRQKNIAVGQITVETLKSLGVDL